MKSTKSIVKTMKTLILLRRFLLAAVVIFTIAFLGLHIWVNLKGKVLLTEKLEKAFNREISIGSLNTSFPVYIHIKNIEAKGLFKVEEIVAGGGLFDIFRKNFRLSLLKMIHPDVMVEKGTLQPATESVILPPAAENVQIKSESKNLTSAPVTAPAAVTKGKFPKFYISRFIVEDGTINFIDRSAGPNGIVIKVTSLNMKVDNLNLSRTLSQVMSFQIKAKIPWHEDKEEGKIEAEGWLNLFKKDMDATLKIQDIDGVYLYPYYSKWVDLEKARIEKAKLNFNSSIHGFHNNITAECHLELTDIVFKPRPAEEQQEKAEKIASAVLDIFKALNQGKIVLDFTLRTKMDRPEFGFSEIKTAVENKIAKGNKGGKFDITDILMFPATLWEGAVKGATDISKAVINGTFALGNGIKKAVDGVFKEEPEEQKEKKEQ